MTVTSFREWLRQQVFQEWIPRIRHEAPGFLVSFLLHAIVLIALSFLALPTQVREDLLNTLIATAARPGDGGGDEGLDATTIDAGNPQDLEAVTKPQANLAMIGNASSLPELNVNNLLPQSNQPGPLQPGKQEGKEKEGPGGGDQAGGRGDLAGRSQKARGSLLAAQGGTPGSEAAVADGLRWLARHQKRDGSWSFEHGPDDPGVISNPTGATGLALLAFLGGGHTHLEGDYQLEVARGIKYLQSQMKVTPAGGDLRSDGDPQGMYAHGICTIALCEAYVLSKDKDLRQPAQLAIDFIVSSQDPKGGGWRYFPKQRGDTSVVGWQIMALKSAKLARLKVPQKTITKSTSFLNSVQSERGSKYGYQSPGKGIGTTSVGLLCRMYLGWTPKQVALIKGVEFLGATGPQPQNIYFDYYATQVMHHWGGDPWKKWNDVMREYLVSTQEKQGDAAGSWKPVSTSHDEATGGRLYRTCMSIMTLEVYYRHLPLYQRETMNVDF